MSRGNLLMLRLDPHDINVLSFVANVYNSITAPNKGVLLRFATSIHIALIKDVKLGT